MKDMGTLKVRQRETETERENLNLGFFFLFPRRMRSVIIFNLSALKILQIYSCCFISMDFFLL